MVMAAAPSGVVLPVGGVIFELHPPLYGSLGENMFSSWTSDGGATGVVTFLEAPLLGPNLAWEVGGRGGDGCVQEVELQGG